MNGMVKSEADKKYPHLVALLKDTHVTIEGGEDYLSFGQRGHVLNVTGPEISAERLEGVEMVV